MFTADGDMRQALNNLQATAAGFGLVSAEHVFKVRNRSMPRFNLAARHGPIRDCVIHFLMGIGSAMDNPGSTQGMEFL